ncbi:lactonase family protein [Fodinicola feengrottensis]|uniref:lactonase family protein n=1 Tax=Fodinicola feengrottensis TaxID=435914 RepID=UPI0013D7F264|nr:beta-propeller fold lactonase family protein [Fodinicola feengrottensis]
MTSQPDLLYVGSYAGAITTVEIGPDGDLTAIGSTTDTACPSFLAAHPSGDFLYAVDEGDEGSVVAYAIRPDNDLERLNARPADGSTTAHLTVDPSGKFVLSANYGSGSVVVHPINPDGSLGERTRLRPTSR